jgi:uncharacterized protein (TIGR00730 family)
MPELKRVCVFCGSRPGVRPAYREAAVAMGRALAERGIGLVYGGGNAGLMGVVADAVLAAGGEAIGIIPQGLVAREVGHTGLTELHVVHTMHERKARMADLADAFVALPGGLGTLEEFCEVLTWTQLGIHAKPGGLLNVDGYYDPFLAMLDCVLGEGFMHSVHREMVLAETEPRALLDRLASYEPPNVPKWIGRGER